MVDLAYQRTILGYHGCDEHLLEKVLLKGEAPSASENDYDWLGKGIYFWEYGPQRAWEWANECAQNRRHRIKIPGVIGAIIHLGTCFDLLDLRNTEYLAKFYPLFKEAFKSAGRELPVNQEGFQGDSSLVLRNLDCAILNWALPQLEEEVGEPFHTVRGVFQEGGPAYPGARIEARSHIQIAVRDPTCIVGYFRPALESSSI